MITRFTTVEDMFLLKQIHREYFAHEFSFPDFNAGYHNVFTITDDNNRIVTVGGIRPILEAVQVTDKSLPVRTRREALLAFMQACMFSAGIHKYDQLHAFIQNEDYYDQLQRYGFRPTSGKPLVIDI